MKLTFPTHHPVRTAAVIAAVGLLTLTSNAKNPKGGNAKGKGHDAQPHGNQGKGHDQDAYHTHPNSTFKLSKGNGHAGPGYYYGPPNAPYYYARPDVRYFANHGAIPREFYNQDAYRMNSDDARVQQALSRLGYYHGSVDGRLGPQSMRAINSYQQSQGQRVTGSITSMLLRSLGLH